MAEEVAIKSTDAHQMELVHAGRCRRCAERVSRAKILRGGECPHCGSVLNQATQKVLDQLEIRRLRWRLAGYGLVGVASFFAGAIPLLQTVVQVVALFILHVIVLRRGLVWLAPGRRIFARLNMKLFGAVVSAMALLINVAIAPFLGFSAFILAATGPVLTAIYVEGGLVIVRSSLRRESEGRRLQLTEWALPVAFIIALVFLVVGTLGLVAGALHLLASLEIPAVGELAETLLELF